MREKKGEEIEDNWDKKRRNGGRNIIKTGGNRVSWIIGEIWKYTSKITKKE